MRFCLAALFAVSAAAQSPLVAWTELGNTGGDFLGFAVSGVGDVNLDGFDDVILGAPFDDNGTAKVLSGLDGSLLHELVGPAVSGGFGFAVSDAGDVNNDGYPDLIVGSYRDDTFGNDAGRATVFSGLDFSVLYTLSNGVVDSQFGYSVSGAGDVDLDGYDDVIVGSPYDQTINAQQLLITPGSATVFSGFDGSVIHKWFGDGNEDIFGHAVSEAGDVNGDGHMDLIVGAPWDDNSFPKSGMARVYSGNPADAASPVLHTFDGDGFGYELGWAVDSMGDLNGDGRPELLVGQPEDKVFGDDAGSVALFSGADGARLHTFYGDAPYEYFGYTVAAADVDHDGVDDVIIGEFRHDVQPFDDRGAVHVYSGAMYDSPQNLLFSVFGDNNGDWFGQAVAAVGDANGDGFDDFVAGCPWADTGNGVRSGYGRVFCGSPAQGSAVTYGVGCPLGSWLSLDYSGTFELDETFHVDLGNGPPEPTVAWVVFAFELGPPFPINLSIVGLPGCQQYVPLDLIGTVAMVGGTASFSLNVPTSFSPCGLVLHNQAIALDANAVNGVRVSNPGFVTLAR